MLHNLNINMVSCDTVLLSLKPESKWDIRTKNYCFMIFMELRNRQEKFSQHIKIDFYNRKQKTPSRRTVTGHCLVFLEKTTDDMDCLPEIKGHYIVTYNTLIYTAKGVNTLITVKGYYHELSPIEQFRTIVKTKSNVVGLRTRTV